jgi:manganese/zinc/iron transport system ATP- binding protein
MCRKSSAHSSVDVSAQNIAELRGVAVGYDRHAVLSGIDLQVPRGSFIGLLGTNGSGKTTLLKTLAGILPPVSGEVVLHSPAVLGYVPQRDQLDSVYIFSAFEVALMGVCGRIGAGRPIPGAERERVHECLRQTGADGFVRQRFAELSGGQKQRVLIARALAAQADFLLLDEPTAGIDAAATQAIMELLVRLHRERGITILMVNHDLSVVRSTAQHIIWIQDGKLVEGSVTDLLRREKIEEILHLQFS